MPHKDPIQRKKYYKSWKKKNYKKILMRKKSYYLKNKEKINKQKQEKYMNDEEYRRKCRVMRNEYYFINKEKILKHQKEYYRKKGKSLQIQRQNVRKINVLRIVGKGKIKCSNCGSNDIRILQINHINGNGTKEYKINQYPEKFYKSIISKNRKINDLNILCQVCNIAYFVKQKFGLEFEIKPKFEGDVNEKDERDSYSQV